MEKVPEEVQQKTVRHTDGAGGGNLWPPTPDVKSPGPVREKKGV